VFRVRGSALQPQRIVAGLTSAGDSHVYRVSQAFTCILPIEFVGHRKFNMAYIALGVGFLLVVGLMVGCAMESPERRKLARTLNELCDYLESNRELIPDYGDRRRHGEAISSSIAESTINQVISRRFVKKQQLRRQPETAHLLLQVGTRTLNGTLRETFQGWWPAMAPISAPGLS